MSGEGEGREEGGREGKKDQDEKGASGMESREEGGSGEEGK